MANSRSDVMANLLATPMVRSSARAGHSRSRSKLIVVTLDNTEAAGHIVPLARFGYADIIHQVWCSHPNIAGATDVNVGVYSSGDWTVADQAVKDVDILVDGYSMAVATAVGKWVDITVANAAGGHTSSTIGRPLYLDAGDTEAQGILAGTYDVAMTFVTDPGAAATIKVLIDYSAGD
jgi:hypothetical protein